MTIGRRNKEQITNENPAPGKYELDSSYAMTKPNQPSANFMFSPERPQFSPEPVPGPGHYESDKIEDRKKMTIG